MRVAMGDPAKVRGELHDPLGIDPGDRTGKALGRLHDLPGHEPFGLSGLLPGSTLPRGLPASLARFVPAPRVAAFKQHRPGKHLEFPVARPLVTVALHPQGNVAQQARQDGPVDGGVIRVALVEVDGAQVLEGAVQLRVKVLPFAHSQIGQEIRLAEPPALALRPERLPLVVDSVPDIKER